MSISCCSGYLNSSIYDMDCIIPTLLFSTKLRRNDLSECNDQLSFEIMNREILFDKP